MKINTEQEIVLWYSLQQANHIGFVTIHDRAEAPKAYMVTHCCFAAINPNTHPAFNGNDYKKVHILTLAAFEQMVFHFSDKRVNYILNTGEKFITRMVLPGLSERQNCLKLVPK